MVDNVELAFPYYYENPDKHRRAMELCDIQYEVILCAQDTGYVAEVYYRIQTWKPFIVGGERKNPKEAIESLLIVSAAVVREASFEKGLPGLGKAKIIGDGAIDEHPKM